MLAAWLDPLGSGASLLISIASTGFGTAAWLCYRLYRLRVSDQMHRREVETRERMHAARLGVAKAIAESGAGVMLGPDKTVVAPPGSPLTVDEVLQAAAAAARRSASGAG